MEIWKPVKGYEGIYEVSSLGRVKSLSRYCSDSKKRIRKIRERVLKQGYTNGYYKVVLCKNGVQKTKMVHQLVAMGFLNHKPCGYKLVVNHKNFNKTDNRVSNLEIVTQRKNTNKKHLNSSSKYLGVSWDKSREKWRADITINNKNVNLGRFTNETDASEAYQSKLKSIKQ